jgi:nucleoside phosphorylase
MKWLIIFATAREAAVTIKMLAADKTSSDRYVFAGGEILICGIGLEMAGHSVSMAPTKGYHWLNVGVAGSVDSSLAVGTCHSVGRVALLHTDNSGRFFACKDPFLLDSRGEASLYSSPVPVYALPDVEVHGALVDMEGYSIARVARERRVPLTIRKVVSDYCCQTSHADILSNIDRLSLRMAEEVVNMLLLESTQRVFSSLQGCSS